MIECLWSSEEFELRSRHRLSIQKLEFFKVQGANQIRKLKEAVFFWSYVLNELNWAGDNICNLIMEKLRNWRLSAIIIDLHNLEFRQQLMLLSQKLGQRQTQLIHNIIKKEAGISSRRSREDFPSHQGDPILSVEINSIIAYSF